MLLTVNLPKAMREKFSLVTVSGGAGAALTGGNFWEGAAIGLVVSALNHAFHDGGGKKKKPKPKKVNNAKRLLAKLYRHYQFGDGEDFYIDASTLNFNKTSQKKLGLSNMKVGESKGVNLFDSGINSNSLAFGKLTMTYQGNNQFSIESNFFDFDYQPKSSLSRNLGTFVGGAVFGRFFNTPMPLPHPFFLQPNLAFGGPFKVVFNGTATIPK